MMTKLIWKDPYTDQPDGSKEVFTIRETWEDGEWQVAKEEYNEGEWCWEGVVLRPPLGWTDSFPVPKFPKPTKNTSHPQSSTDEPPQMPSSEQE